MEIRTLRKPALIAGSVATAFLLMKFLRRPAVKQKLGDIFDAGCTKLDHLKGWSTLPTVGGLVTLVGVRNTLRAKNLYDTGVPEVMTENPLPAHPNVDIWRTPDGTSNDLKCPFMGSAGTRFGRNAPLSGRGRS